MKKYLVSIALICMLSCITIFGGCTSPLENAPTTTSAMIVNGNAVTYNDYVYFANTYVEYSKLTKDANNVGKADNDGFYRIKSGKITVNEETKINENVELVLSKVLGSNNSMVYSIGKYIYFASPNTHKDKAGADKFELNSYFRINTDGTGLKEFYTSNNQISQQSVLKLGEDYYLVLVDGSELVKIKLGDSISGATTIAKDFATIVFANKATNENDKFAYYLAIDKSLENKGSENTSKLYKVNIIDGTKVELTQSGIKSDAITLKSVIDGKLYFINTEDSAKYYEEYATGNFSTRTKLTPAISDTLTINSLNVLKVQSPTVTAQFDIYYIFSVTTTNFNGLIALKSGDTDLANPNNTLINSLVNVLFIDGDYIYYSVASTGIYRISVKDKEVQTISDKTEFKTNNISFDGTYIYFYAQGDTEVSTAYYMHRAKVNVGEVQQEPNVELIGKVFEDPEEETTPEA